MYDKGLTTGALALTGASVIWPALAAFAFLAAGLALLRIAPKIRIKH